MVTLPAAALPVMVDYTLHPPTNRSTKDRPDYVLGAQIHFIYAIPADGVDRSMDLQSVFINSIGAWNTWLAG